MSDTINDEVIIMFWPLYSAIAEEDQLARCTEEYICKAEILV